MAISKETIIQEIQRLAHANDDSPPGQDRFESESGIPRKEWLAKHWEKWSDALKEAGFDPNKKNEALPVEQILEALAKFTREKQQIPTQIQIQMKARKETGFPWPGTVNRLGTKSEQIEKLLAYCRSHSEYSEVEIICEEALSRHKTDDRTAMPESDSADGFVYLFKSGRRYKFGFTNDPDRRIRELGYQTAEPISTVHSIRTDDPSGIEAYWKRRFADKCVHNEWFALTAKDVAVFKRRKRFM